MGVDDITVMMALLFILLVASINVATQATIVGLEDNLLWEKFKLQHVKAYSHREEEEVRKDIFRANLRKIGAHNEREERGLETWRMAVTQFADLTEEEFKQEMIGGRREWSLMPKTREAVALVGLLQRWRISSPMQPSTMSLSLSSALKR